MRTRLRKLGPPTILLVLTTWLLVGCIYVPWFEQRSNPKQIDFRPMVGDARSDKPIRVGYTTRDQLVRILGKPTYGVENGRVIGYGIDTFYGYWVAPLCFAAERGLLKGTVVRFEFDDHDVLTRYDIESKSLLIRIIEWDGMAQQDAIDQLEKRGLPVDRTMSRHDRGHRPADNQDAPPLLPEVNDTTTTQPVTLPIREQ